jgi:hypothetical protein
MERWNIGYQKPMISRRWFLGSVIPKTIELFPLNPVFHLSIIPLVSLRQTPPHWTKGKTWSSGQGSSAFVKGKISE